MKQQQNLQDYKVMFGEGVGEGYITTSPITDANKEPVTLAGETLIAGEKTTLQGFFLTPIEYVGCIKKQGKNLVELIFNFASESNIFETKFYYETLYKVDENRTFKMFSYRGGRDFNFINNKWK